MRNKECLGQWGKEKAAPFPYWIFYTVRSPLLIFVQLWERCLRKEVLKWDPNQDLVCNWEILVFQPPISTSEGTEQIDPHRWINSGIRQRRNSYVRTFLSSSLIPEEDQSSNYSYISSQTGQEKRVLLSGPSFLGGKNVWASSQVCRAPSLCTHCEENQNKWDGERAFHCRELLDLGSLPSFVGRILGQVTSFISSACESRATDGSFINTRSKGKPQEITKVFWYF